MLNFHKSKGNSNIEDMSTLSYQHNNLNKDGCMEMDAKVPGFMGRVYLNKSLYSQEFIDKVAEAKKSGKTDNINVWWASRPISLDWEALVKDVTELNPSCEEIVSNAAKKNNLFFSLSSLDKPITLGGTRRSPITDLHVEEHPGKSSNTTNDKYSFQDRCYVFANFSDWTSGTSSKPSFPKKLTISKICNNKSVDVDEQERKILVNYIQNFSEQWKCITIIFESQKSSYGYDGDGKKEASSLTGAFPDVPGVCPTPKQKSVTEEPPKKPSKATDITAAMESKQKLEPPSSDSGEEDKTDEKEAEVKPVPAKKAEVKVEPLPKKEEANPTEKKEEVKPVPVKKAEVKVDPLPKKEEPNPTEKKAETKPVPAKKAEVKSDADAKKEVKPVVKTPIVKKPIALPAKKVGNVRVKTRKKTPSKKNTTKKKRKGRR